MNFLIKIEDAINRFIENILTKLKSFTPGFIFFLLHGLLHLPQNLIKLLKATLAQIQTLKLKAIGHIQNYTTSGHGQIISTIMYLRSEEFKKANKKELLLKPIQYAKVHPLHALAFLGSCSVFLFLGMIIFQNTQKIMTGTRSLRKPASVEIVTENNFIEFKNHKFEVKIAPASGGHGGGGEAHEYEIFLNIKIEAQNEQEKAFLEEMEEMLDDNLEALELPIHELPLSVEEQKKIAEHMIKSLNEDFKHIGHEHAIRDINVEQVMPNRPIYYRQPERMLKIEDINLQLFMEDTHRNKQVWIDFSILASNRNVVLYLQDHDVELKDHLSTNVEPIIPQLPVEDEGRRIIKDKIKSELNQFLEKNKIEGKILEVYLDYIMVS